MGYERRETGEEWASLHVVKAGAACVGVAIVPTPGRPAISHYTIVLHYLHEETVIRHVRWRSDAQVLKSSAPCGGIKTGSLMLR